jgi:hypothetical protein
MRPFTRCQCLRDADGGTEVVVAMTIFIILFGVMMGTQYRVACMIPTTLVAILGSAAIDRINHLSLISIVATALAVAAALQIGYLIGASLRLVLRAAQASSATEAGNVRGWPGRIG